MTERLRASFVERSGESLDETRRVLLRLLSVTDVVISEGESDALSRAILALDQAGFAELDDGEEGELLLVLPSTRHLRRVDMAKGAQLM